MMLGSRVKMVTVSQGAGRSRGYVFGATQVTHVRSTNRDHSQGSRSHLKIGEVPAEERATFRRVGKGRTTATVRGCRGPRRPVQWSVATRWREESSLVLPRWRSSPNIGTSGQSGRTMSVDWMPTRAGAGDEVSVPGRPTSLLDARTERHPRATSRGTRPSGRRRPSDVFDRQLPPLIRHGRTQESTARMQHSQLE